jgi:VWFA-related protein
MSTRIHIPLLAAMTMAAQQAPPATFRAGTQLVQLSVIAQDQQGNPVVDLRREEFKVFDNGAPQEIRLFLAETDKPSFVEPEPGASNTFTNRIAAAGGSRGGYSVLLFDNNNTAFEHTARARQKALQALQSIPPGDKIAIYSLWCRFQVIREFTSDRESLLRQLNAFAPAASGCGSGAGDDAPPADRTASKSKQLKAFEAEAAASRARAAEETDRIASLQADSLGDQEIKNLADHLAGIPGRKNLIWLAAQFPLSPSTLQRLINAGVAIYPVDAVGSTIALAADKADHSAALRALAAMTGGVAYFDRDDLDVAVREALDDGRVSYTLGFYPSGDVSKPGVHQLGVRVSRAGVTLRYRTSYTAEPPRSASASPLAELVQALNQPVDATAIPITASATRVQDRLDLSVSIDVSGLDLELNLGLWKGSAELVARFLTAEGALAGEVFSQRIAFNLRPATYSSILQSGVPYRKTMKIPAKAVELRLLFGNLATGKIGTLTIPVPK